MLLATANIGPNVRHDDGLHCSTSIVKQLLARDDIDVNAIGFRDFREIALLVTCDLERSISDKRDEEIIHLLLDKADINVNFSNIWGDTALMLAARYRKMSVVKSLIARNDVNPNACAPTIST